MKEENNYSSEINADISYPQISESGTINKNCASYAIPSRRDQNLYKTYELFLSRNKFHLNNNYDKNNAQKFLKEKNQYLANVDLDDYIEGEQEELRTIVENSKNQSIYQSKNQSINQSKNQSKNQIQKQNQNQSNNYKKNNLKNNDINNKNGKISNKNINNKNDNKNQNQSFEAGTGCPPGSLFDTGKADLLCLLLGMSNNNMK
jgi:hypothetical protein